MATQQLITFRQKEIRQKRSDRPRLAEALKACRLQGAKLIIAKLDRLARNVAFISNLMESKVEFEAVDFPQANRLTIHIMAAIAEHEAKMISDRTRAALAAAKARGKRLGGFRGRAGTALISRQSSKTYELPVQIRGVHVSDST
jgi:DNA invertase Pin-like site-specific DNA recombinase